MARRVRTPAGVRHFGKPVGAVIGRSRVRGDEGGFIPKSYGRGRRAASAARARKGAIIGDVNAASDALDLARVGARLTRRERDLAEFSGPRARQQAIRERGTAIKPRRVALSDARSRHSRQAARTVSRNPFTDQPVVQRELGKGVTRRASAARAAARRAPTVKVPEYVGKRRAKD